MVFTLPTGITHGSKSRVSNPKLHPGFDEQYNNNDSRDRGGYNHHDLWVRIKQMVWVQHNPHLGKLWRDSRQRFNLYNSYSWKRLFLRGGVESSKSGDRTDRNRKNYRNGLYYCLLVSLLSVAPVKAEGETNNTSNPVAAATGNVTNQAVQFQNNGAPSRQYYGDGISCNGATMTFSPFYMGNHTVPYDENMNQRTYTISENWGGQVNFMIPLDRKGLESCRRLAVRREEKERLDYELVRALKCAELQRKGFTIAAASPVYKMCSDIVPIVAYNKQKKAAIKQHLETECTPIKKKRIWKKQKYKCPIKTEK